MNEINYPEIKSPVQESQDDVDGYSYIAPLKERFASAIIMTIIYGLFVFLFFFVLV